MIPVLIVGGAAAAAGLGYLWYESGKKKSPLPENVKPPPAPPVLANPVTGVAHTAATSPNAPLAPPVTNVIKTPSGKPLVILTPKAPDGSPTVAATVATSGPAKDPAHSLYDWLSTKGVAGSSDLVTAFQQAANADADSKKLHGPIAVNGRYDLPTSAALTIYTGLPIPPDPSAPPMVTMSKAQAQAHPESVDFTSPGPAAMAASNLWAYLKMHGNPNKGGKAFKKVDPVLFALVQNFQNAVNIDPKFPGPSYAFPKLSIIKAPLAIDGQYGGKTSDALAAVSLERIAP
jgi:hypothetical protein